MFIKDHPDYVQRSADGSVRVVHKGFPVPLVNFGSCGLRSMLVANMVRQARHFGVDGFRTDMSDSVPLDFWAETRAATGSATTVQIRSFRCRGAMRRATR